ncbi:MAG TPA: urate oxidase [Blastocatellia bacterium]|nr:urate oxidase [Blastocatellia bacterium]
MSVILAHNNYGKSKVRMVKVARHGDRHDLQEINVDIACEGDFETAHTLGDNSKVLPTDTMKNTVYALAKQVSDIEEIEAFALRLKDHFLNHNPQLSRITIEIDESMWTRILVGGKSHHHSFTKGGDEKHTTKVIATRDMVTIESGISDLLILKTTGSGFSGFIKDQYTTLPETTDRIFATVVKASWLYAKPEVATRTTWQGVRQLLLETFALHNSFSVQQTLYAMGENILENFADISEISLSLPNKHCLLVNLSAFGMENNNEIFVPTDEPHGLIEARLSRD